VPIGRTNESNGKGIRVKGGEKLKVRKKKERKKDCEGRRYERNNLFSVEFNGPFYTRAVLITLNNNI
jgi:hypothetical protein